MTSNKFQMIVLILLFSISVLSQTEQIVSSGGAFTMTKTVIAGGGREKQLSPMSEHGTTGQTIAGVRSSGGNFTLYSGFWTPDDFAPTAATVTVGGRILTADGNGIKNVSVIITSSNGQTRTAVSGSFGYYTFFEIPAGETCIISVSAKRYTFSSPTQVRTVLEDVMDVNFVADAPQSSENEEQP